MKIPAAILSFCLPAVAATFLYNQVAYEAGQPKTLVVASSYALAGAPFELMREGKLVYSGVLKAGALPAGWGKDSFFVADFSKWQEEGTYTLRIQENAKAVESASLFIENRALASRTLKDVMGYFRASRADDESVWNEDASIGFYGDYGGKTHNVQGGWYDASGDISKYLSHLNYTQYLVPQQTPLTVWALAFAVDRTPLLLEGEGLLSEAKAEAIWGADFLVRMQDETGYFYTTVFDGWTGMLAQRQICAFSGTDGIRNSNYQAAMREGGGMAIAALARVASWNLDGAYASSVYLDAAEKGYAHLQEKQTLGGECAYCDDGVENIIDDYTGLLAASELYAATKNEAYLEQARQRATHLTARLSSEGYFYSDNERMRPFWHASDAGLPLMALARYKELEIDGSKPKAVASAIQAHLDWLLGITDAAPNPFGYARQAYNAMGSYREGFFIPHDNESAYWWQGENARLASLAAAAVYGARQSKGEVPEEVQRYAQNQLDWILGKNPYGICFMEGQGIKNPGSYVGEKSEGGTLAGGIANGITGSDTTGEGLAWKTAANFSETWRSWRWVEQWLPHTSWFLLALAAQSDEVEPPQGTLPGVMQTMAGFQASLRGHDLELTWAASGPRRVTFTDTRGRVISPSSSYTGQRALVSIPSSFAGLLLVGVEGLGSRSLVIP